jgi:hypothetical protein
MFGAILKKRLTSSQFANIFINAIFESTEKGFSIVADMINNDPSFVSSPNINSENFQPFQLIVLSANFQQLDKFFEPQEASDIKVTILSKLASIYDVEPKVISDIISNYCSFISRVNHPSKTMLYGLSKAVAYKYELSDFQDEYFKRMQAPNPLFLKRLDTFMESFIWDWEVFMKKYKI